MRIIYTVNEPRLTCSLFLSKLICSPVIGIVIHLSTLKIWVSQGGLFISTYNKQICKLFYQRRKALGQSGVPVLRLAAAEDKADSETVPSLKENGTTAPITKYSNQDFASRPCSGREMRLSVTHAFGQNLHEKRGQFPAERNAVALIDQHDRRDISQKPPFVVADPKEGPGPLFLETPPPPPAPFLI